MTTYEGSDGVRRSDVVGTFVTRRGVQMGQRRIWRLAVDAAEEPRDVFLPPNYADVRFDLRTGDDYVFTGVRICESPERIPRTGGECPSCDGVLREWAAIDDYPVVRAALPEFDVDDEFYLVDGVTTVHSTDQGRTARHDVADWRPWRTEPPAGSVCVDCDREVEHSATGKSGSGGHPTPKFSDSVSDGQ